MTEKKKRILVLEDEELVIDIVREILDVLGYESTFTREGSETVKKYRESFNNRQPFDLMILDLTIPDGMGGREALSGILEFDPYAKALVSSGVSSTQLQVEYRTYGFKGALQKPFTIATFRDAINNII